MSKLPGWLKAVLFLVVAGIVLVTAALQLMPTEKLRRIAEEKAGSALGRQVRLKTLSLGWRGLRLGGIELSALGGFDAGTLCAVESVSARWDLRALLKKQVRIHEVALSGFDCEVTPKTLGPGASKPAQPAAKPKAAKKGKSEPAAEGEPFALDVSRVSAEKGTVDYDDGAGTRVILTGLAASARGVKLAGGPMPFKLSAAFKGRASGKDLDGRIDAEGSVDLRATMTTIELDKLSLLDAGIQVTVKGKVSSAPGALAAALKGETSALEAKSLAKLGVSIPTDLPPVKFDADVERKGTAWRIKKADLALAGSTLKLSGTVRPAAGKDAGDCDLRVEADGLKLEEWGKEVASLAPYSPSGIASLDVDVSGTAATPKIAGKASIDGLSAKVSGLPLTGARVEAKFDPTTASASVKGKLGAGDLKVDLSAKGIGTAPDVHVEGSLSAIDLAKLQSAAEAGDQGQPAESGPAETESPSTSSTGDGDGTAAAGAGAGRNQPLRTSGKFSLGAIKHPNFEASGAKAEWNLTGVTPDLKRLAGKLKFDVGPGKFEDLAPLAGKSPALKAALTPLLVLQKIAGLVKLPLFPAFDRVKFKDITGDYVAENGVMTVKESHMDADSAYVQTTGSIDFGNDRVDLRISTKLGTQVGLKLGGPLAVLVKGSLKNPSVKPDIAAVLKQPGVEKAIEEGKKALQNLFRR